MDETSKLSELRDDFLGTSTQSMPIAGMIFWAVIGAAALYVKPQQLAYMVLFGSGMVFPLGVIIDRLTGRRMKRASTQNPVVQLFMQSLALVVLVWPLVIIGAQQAHDGNLIVLGGAILMGVIWIPYGWAANDRVGMQHAIARSVFSYIAYLFAPIPYKATAISAVVLLCYLYSIIRMRKPASVQAV
ncbi:MAG: hypothetical protein WBS24_12900 [Terriglobales bacterium]